MNGTIGALAKGRFFGELRGIDEDGEPVDAWQLFNDAKNITLVMNDGKKIDVFITRLNNALATGQDLPLSFQKRDLRVAPTRSR